jgi:hypothetical protein
MDIVARSCVIVSGFKKKKSIFLIIPKTLRLKILRMLSKKLKSYIPLPYTFNVKKHCSIDKCFNGYSV